MSLPSIQIVHNNITVVSGLKLTDDDDNDNGT